jgi:large repetitive protein
MRKHLLNLILAITTLLVSQAVGILRAAPPAVTSATLTAWLDATDPNGDGTTPASGTSVAAWVNKASGGIGDFGLSIGGTVSPIYVANSGAFNGLPVVRFAAGTGKWLTNTVNLGNNVTVIYAGRKNGTDSGRLVSARFNNWLLGYWGTRMGCSFWNSVGNYQGTATSDNRAHVWVGAANGTQFQVYQAEPGGETLVDSGNLGQGPNGLSLGSYNNGAEVGGGDIGELLVYNGALSPADRTTVEAYLVSRWIPTIPVIDAAPQPIAAYVSEYAALSVTPAGNAPFSYQWRKEGADIAGATNATYTFSGALATNDSGSYTVVVTNTLGGVTSAPASVAVLPVAAMTAGLAAYWALDETSGATANDSTPNANHGALVNFPADDSQWVPGQVGGALYFRGEGGAANTSNYVSVADYPKPTTTLTISAWVWADARPAWASIIKNWPGSQQQFHFGLQDTAGDLSNYLVQQGGSQLGPVREGAGTPLPTNSWQHVALVCDGRMMRLYRNGAPVGTPLAYNGTIQNSPVNPYLSIGAKRNGAVVDSYWQGKMDDLGLWARGLPADQILSIYKAGTNGQPLTSAVLGNPPEITVQPQSMTRYAGEFGTPLSAAAAGTEPLSYQWRQDDVDVPGASSSTLNLGQLTNGSGGSYTLVVTNAHGSVTSAPAVITVIDVTAVSDALVGYWNFDEGTGSILVDNSGYGNDGTLMNFPGDDSQWVEGRIGGALNFRGPANADYAVVPNYPKPTATLTITAWVWANARSQWATVVKNWPSTASQFHFGLNDTQGDLSNYLIQQNGTQLGPVREGAGTPLPLNSWQHVALVCDGSKMQIYRNGAPVGSPLAYNGTINTNLALQSLGIGAKLGPGGVPPTTTDSGYWNGKMDDLGLWMRALSADEILAVYVAGLNSAPLTDAIVGALPPAIGTPPQSVTVTEGESATFGVDAGGTPTLFYQWRKNGTDITDATNTSLTLANLCAGDAGEFDVVIRNVAGSVTSTPPATLTILPLTSPGPITAGLIGHWPFDETSGMTAMDASTYANQAFLTNFPGDNSQWVVGQIGGALNFRGPGFGDYALVPDYPKPASSLTVSAWVWADARPTWASIVKNWSTQVGGEFHFGLNNVEGDLSNYLIEQDGGFVGPVREGAASPLPLGSWQHVALVCDGSKQQLYRNGLPVGLSLPYDGTINTSLTSPMLAIGAKLLAGGLPPADVDSGFWQGKMDDIGLWDRGLAPAEIQAIYNAGLRGRDLASASVLPALTIVRVDNSLTLSWPASPAGSCYALESADTLPPVAWTPVSEARSLNSGYYSVTVPATGAARFYQLVK